MSDCWIDIPPGSGFGLANLPLAIATRPGGTARAFTRVGDHGVDLSVLADAGLVDDPDGDLSEPTLNRFLARGSEHWDALRKRLAEVLTDGSAAERGRRAVVACTELELGLPVAVHDYVDFYSSLHHATNLGRILRPGTEPLPAAWRHLPIGYHARAGTLVPSGAAIPRPSGLHREDDAVVFGPTQQLDLELEVGFVVGTGNERGTPVAVDDAGDHIAGFCLVNDWSARDIQAFEYQPLGPLLGKSFATSVSPWLVSTTALAPHRVAPPEQDPPVAPYLRATQPWGLALHLEVALSSVAMREAGTAPVVISRTCFDDMYWTPAQQLAHATVNGASTATGDLFASGTVSGPRSGTEGSLIELTERGEQPLGLPDGTTRSFLLDGDEVVLRGWAGEGDDAVSLGEVVGRVVGPSDPTEEA